MEGFVKVVLMAIDECGDDFRVNDTIYTIPRCVYEDYFLLDCWGDDIIKPYMERYPEARNFHFERPFSDYSLGELEEYGEAMGWL